MPRAATTPHQIDLWRGISSENQRIEFKEAKNQFDYEKSLKYCVALANEGGGILLFGIQDKPPRPVVGSAFCTDIVDMAEKLFTQLGFRIDIEEVQHTDGRVVVFHIPSRPRGTAYNLKGTYLMRSGEQLVPMTEDHLRTIFAEGEPNWLEEHSHLDLESEQVLELLDSEAFFSLLQLPYPANSKSVVNRLITDRLVDEIDGKYAIRRLAGLLLAKHLDEFPDLARKAPRVVVYIGTSKLETRIDRTGNKGYAVGFQGLVNFILEQLPQNEVIEDAIRKSVKLVSSSVVRELVANALIHQDFSIGGSSVMMEIYSDRMEISSPGDPIVPVQRFIDGYQSRNERLADFMRRFGICEEKSSGIDRVIMETEIYQLPAPNFRAGQKRTHVTIYGPIEFEKMDRNDRVRACYQHCALKYVMNQNMTNQTLRDRFQLPETKSAIISQIISYSIEENLIKLDSSVGPSKKYARYLPYWA